MLCKDFNVKQLEQGSWLTYNDLNNEATYDINELRNSYAIGVGPAVFPFPLLCQRFSKLDLPIDLRTYKLFKRTFLDKPCTTNARAFYLPLSTKSRKII